MDRYVATKPIGGGAFGQVWQGDDLWAKKLVALKFIPKFGQTSMDTDKKRIDIEKEILSLRLVDHPNIIKLEAVLDLDYFVVLVTDLALGSLEKKLELPVCLPLDEVHGIAVQLMQGLKHMHFRGLIHGDIKPANVLCYKGNKIKICDLGFTGCVPSPEMAMNATQGTPAYMSPELLNFLPYDFRVDTWAAGVTIYQIAVGHLPFQGSDTMDMEATRTAILKGRVYYPGGTPPLLQAFLEALLEKDPQRRWCLPALYEHPYLTLPAALANQGSQHLELPFALRTPLLRSSLKKVAEAVLPDSDCTQFPAQASTTPHALIVGSPVSNHPDSDSPNFPHQQQSQTSSREALHASVDRNSLDSRLQRLEPPIVRDPANQVQGGQQQPQISRGTTVAAHALSTQSSMSQDSLNSENSPAMDALAEALMAVDQTAQEEKKAVNTATVLADAATDLAALAEHFARRAKEADMAAKNAAVSAAAARQKYQELKAREAQCGREDAVPLVKAHNQKSQTFVANALRALKKLGWTPAAVSSGTADRGHLVEAHSSAETASSGLLAPVNAKQTALGAIRAQQSIAHLQLQNHKPTAEGFVPPPTPEITPRRAAGSEAELGEADSVSLPRSWSSFRKGSDARAGEAEAQATERAAEKNSSKRSLTEPHPPLMQPQAAAKIWPFAKTVWKTLASLPARNAKRKAKRTSAF